MSAPLPRRRGLLRRLLGGTRTRTWESPAPYAEQPPIHTPWLPEKLVSGSPAQGRSGAATSPAPAAIAPGEWLPGELAGDAEERRAVMASQPTAWVPTDLTRSPADGSTVSTPTDPSEWLPDRPSAAAAAAGSAAMATFPSGADERAMASAHPASLETIPPTPDASPSGARPRRRALVLALCALLLVGALVAGGISLFGGSSSKPHRVLALTPTTTIPTTPPPTTTASVSHRRHHAAARAHHATARHRGRHHASRSPATTAPAVTTVAAAPPATPPVTTTTPVATPPPVQTQPPSPPTTTVSISQTGLPNQPAPTQTIGSGH